MLLEMTNTDAVLGCFRKDGVNYESKGNRRRHSDYSMLQLQEQANGYESNVHDYAEYKMFQMRLSCHNHDEKSKI